MAKHTVTWERVMRPSVTFPHHLEATDDLDWSCSCGDSGVTRDGDEFTHGKEH